MGMESVALENGQRAVEEVTAASERRCCSGYSVVFMDLNMPVMDGIRATRTIKELF